MRNRHKRFVVKPQNSVRPKQPSTMPAVTFRPKSKGGEIGRLTHGSPSVGVFSPTLWLALQQKAQVMSESPSLVLVEHRFGFFDSPFAPFSTKIDQPLSVRRQVAAPRIHLPVEPLTMLEGVSVGVPLHYVKPLARPTTENDPNWSLSGEDDMYPGAGLFRDATQSSIYFFRDGVFHCSVCTLAFSANASFEVFDSCCHGLLKELQHEFAIASTEDTSHFRENGSKQNQNWWNDQSDPRVSCGVVTSGEHVEQGEHKYRRSAKDCEPKPETQ